MKIEEKEILGQINEALSTQIKNEKKYWEKLSVPEYHKPNYKFWWVFAPLATIAIALIIMIIVPTQNHYPSLAKIDSEISEVDSEVKTLSVNNTTNDIDKEMENIDKNIKTLKEEKL